MSITPPETYTYGTVIWRALNTVVDSADVDRYPDVTPATGTVTFTPKVSYYKNLNLPATFITTSVVGTLDSAGYLMDAQGNVGVVLTDPSSPGISPSGWTYSVSMSVMGKTLPSFDITVVGGMTIDLTTVMPAATSTGTVTIVSEAARVAAEAARDEVVAIRDDLIENPPGGGGGVPNGGTANQTIFKVDSTDGNVVWHTLVKADVGLGNVDNTSDANKPVSTATTTQLNLKAPLASPALTGSPTAPTPTAGDNDTSIATTAFVTGAITTSAATKANTSHTHAQADVTNLTTDLAARSLKTVTGAYRVKSGSTDVGAGPGWPVRPTGYPIVISVGDPAPTDQVAGDIRMLPAP